MMENDFLRYSCQLALPGFDKGVQEKLQAAKVLIVGAGGLGCPCALYLTAAGVGTIGLADDDQVSISNLHRQVLYSNQEVGLLKAVTACKKLQTQNPGITLVPITTRITVENVMDEIRRYDIVVDCTDNFDTKYLLNDACVLQGKPLVYGAIYQFEGQVSVFNVSMGDGQYSPNFRDLFPGVNAVEIPNCAEGGVMPTLAGIIGCLQANETIKYITGQGELLASRLLMFDVQSLQSCIIKTKNVNPVAITALSRPIDVPVITGQQLNTWMEREDFQLVDVRTVEEFAEGNIGGNNIPLQQIEQWIPTMDVEKSWVFCCASGKRSAEAVKLVKKQFPDSEVYSLQGGLKSWDRQKLS